MTIKVKLLVPCSMRVCQLPDLLTRAAVQSGSVSYLVSPHQVNHDKHIGNVNEPVWVEEAESCQKIARSVIAKASIPYAAHSQIEACGDENG